MGRSDAGARPRDAAAATGPVPPMEGVDVEGTGPDTGGDMPPSEEPKYETTCRRRRPAADRGGST